MLPYRIVRDARWGSRARRPLVALDLIRFAGRPARAAENSSERLSLNRKILLQRSTPSAVFFKGGQYVRQKATSKPHRFGAPNRIRKPPQRGREDRRYRPDREIDGHDRLRAESVALIDFGTATTPSFPIQRRRSVRHGDVSVVRCTLPPNPGIALGASQFTVAIHQDRPFDMEWRLPESSRTQQQRIHPGQAHINGPDRPVFQRWSASPAILVVALEPEFVHQIEGEVFGRDEVWLETRIGVDDPVLKSIAEVWSRELLEIRAGGRLFTESLGAFLTLHLFRTYCDQVPPPDQATGGLGPSRQRRVLDYMDARLGDDISLKELAAIADLSVHHFGAAFKATTGVSPHRFLMERRIQRGKELLLEPGPSIASIALAGISDAVRTVASS